MEAKSPTHLSAQNYQHLSEKIKQLSSDTSLTLELSRNHGKTHSYTLSVTDQELVAHTGKFIEKRHTSQSVNDNSTRSQLINSTLASDDLPFSILKDLIVNEGISEEKLDTLAKSCSLKRVLELHNALNSYPDFSHPSTKKIICFIKIVEFTRFKRYEWQNNPNQVIDLVESYVKESDKLNVLLMLPPKLVVQHITANPKSILVQKLCALASVNISHLSIEAAAGLSAILRNCTEQQFVQLTSRFNSNDCCKFLIGNHPYRIVNILLLMPSNESSKVFVALTRSIKQHKPIEDYGFVIINDVEIAPCHFAGIISRLATMGRTELTRDSGATLKDEKIRKTLDRLLSEIPVELFSMLLNEKRASINLITAAIITNWASHSSVVKFLEPSYDVLLKDVNKLKTALSDAELSVIALHLDCELLFNLLLKQIKVGFKEFSAFGQTYTVMVNRIKKVAFRGSTLTQSKYKNYDCVLLYKQIKKTFLTEADRDVRYKLFCLLGSDVNHKLELEYPDLSACITQVGKSPETRKELLGSLRPSDYGLLEFFLAIEPIPPEELSYLSPKLWCEWLSKSPKIAGQYFLKLSKTEQQQINRQLSFHSWSQVAKELTDEALFLWIDFQSPEQVKFWCDFDKSCPSKFDFLLQIRHYEKIGKLPTEVIIREFCYINSSEKKITQEQIVNIFSANFCCDNFIDALIKIEHSCPGRIKQILTMVNQQQPAILTDVTNYLTLNDHKKIVQTLGVFLSFFATQEQHESAKKIQLAYRNYKSHAISTRSSEHNIKKKKFFFDRDGLYPPIRQPVVTCLSADMTTEISKGACKVPTSADQHFIEFSAIERALKSNALVPVTTDSNCHQRALLNKMKEAFILSGKNSACPFTGSSIQPATLGIAIDQQRVIAARVGNDLSAYLNSERSGGKITSLKLFKNLVTDMEALHSHHIYLRDIKSQNLLYVDMAKNHCGEWLRLEKPLLLFIDISDACYYPNEDSENSVIGKVTQYCGTPVLMTQLLVLGKCQGDRDIIKSADIYAMLLTILGAVSPELRKYISLPAKSKETKGDTKKSSAKTYDKKMYKHGLLHSKSLPYDECECFKQSCKPYIKPEYLHEVFDFLSEPSVNTLKHPLSEILNWEANEDSQPALAPQHLSNRLI